MKNVYRNVLFMIFSFHLFLFCKNENSNQLQLSSIIDNINDTNGIIEVNDTLKFEFWYMKSDTLNNILSRIYYDEDVNKKLLTEHFILEDSTLRINNYLLFDKEGDTLYGKSNYLSVLIKDSLITTRFYWNYEFNYSIFLFKDEKSDSKRLDFQHQNDTINIYDYLTEKEWDSINYGIVLYLSDSKKRKSETIKGDRITTAWRHYFSIPK